MGLDAGHVGSVFPEFLEVAMFPGGRTNPGSSGFSAATAFRLRAVSVISLTPKWNAIGYAMSLGWKLHKIARAQFMTVRSRSQSDFSTDNALLLDPLVVFAANRLPIPEGRRRASAYPCLARFGLLTLLSTASSAFSQPGHAVGPTNRTITTAGEAHGLPSAVAALQIPVHLRGVVTTVDPSTVPGHSAFFLHDSTGGIYVMVEDSLRDAFPSGTTVDVEGVTGAGTAAPIVDYTRVHATGHAALPANPPLEDLFHLETGAADAKWVEVEGTVHSVLKQERSVTLQLAMLGDNIRVIMQREPGVDYDNLVDAKVRIRGNAAPMFNRNDQIIGARLMTPGMSAVRILEAAPVDPYAQPVTSIDELLRWSEIAHPRHRVHLRGQVTLQWPGISLCLRDTTGAICANTNQNTDLAVGDGVDVVGFSAADSGSPILVDATFKKNGRNMPVNVKPVTAERALLGKDGSQLVEIEGTLIGNDLLASGNTLLLTSDNIIFTALVPNSAIAYASAQWKIGSRLRMTGILSVHFDVESTATGSGIAAAKSFQILMRSPQDVTVVRRPTWWTAGHTIVVLGLLLTVVLCAVGWITRLRHRVHIQNAALEKAREESEAIDELAKAMQEVTSERNLTARVSATGSKQIFELGIGFNRMISELEEGDRATRAAEAKLQNQALTDELTGLPNRRALSERLEASLEVARREERILAVLFIDLDGFKAVNDNLGHAFGDILLTEVARRLQSRTRKTDTVARLGGDEFTVLLTTLRSPYEAAIVANGVLNILAENLVIEGSLINISASVGISVFPQDGVDAESLIQNADSAMYAAKGSGKNKVHRFTAELGSSVQERVSLESQLREAIIRQEIHLEYQPEFDLESCRVIRFEALARWMHPVLGKVPPGKFIPIAEETGQIVALGAHVLRQACMEAVRWQAVSNHPIQVAVNVSSLQFVRPDFVDEVVHILDETGLRPGLLQIELTESIMLSGVERAAGTMKQLRDHGVSLAIDDFGTGYSCLSYLPGLPFDTLKIDRSFVRNLASSPGAKSVVTFLIALAHSLNMKVVVEGIETKDQLEIIRTMHGTQVQGFLLGRPIPNPQSMMGPHAYLMDLEIDLDSSMTHSLQVSHGFARAALRTM